MSDALEVAREFSERWARLTNAEVMGHRNNLNFNEELALFLDRVRAEALEGAAKIADNETRAQGAATHIANAIRALIPKGEA